TGGFRIGAYEVISRLRAGGMATVYLGQKRGPAGFYRKVVIKVIHPHLGQDEHFIRMFMDEARISAQVTHPNVVHVEEFGEDHGMFYLVMEHVNGCSLLQLMRSAAKQNRRLPVEVAVHLAIKAATGLHAAHETADEKGQALGIVHRDVSPSNILVSRDGQVKVIDFG